MTIYGAQTGAACGSITTSDCLDPCGSNCPDFTIKRHDTVPAFKVSVEDCDGPLDLTDPDIVVEVNMWAKGKLKKALTASVDDNYFALADNIGFNQILAGDVIVMDRARLPEHMRVIGFDENNYFIQVERGYHGTPIGSYSKGSSLKILKGEGNSIGTIEFQKENILNVDGTTTADQLMNTFLVYNWMPSDTCLAGCFMLEFKVLKVSLQALTALGSDISVIPSFTPSTADFGCMTLGAEWVRRFPVSSDGFIIQVVDTPTAG